MRLLFVCYALHHQGSAQDIYNYTQVARELGHEVVLYAPEGIPTCLTCSSDVASADALVVVLETNLFLHYGAHLSLVRLLTQVPRHRRVIIDCDGKYNAAIRVRGDYNHQSPSHSRCWIRLVNSLSDKICQASLQPREKNVRSFLFHGYNPAWERPDGSGKTYSMVYVGNNWFRWLPMERLLRALEPIRERLSRICLVGHGWDSTAWWSQSNLREDAYRTDPEYLRKLRVEVAPPTSFAEAIEWMSCAVFNPVIYRPLFNRLQMVTCRTFETPAAATIPLFEQDEEYVRAVYGARAVELMLGRNLRDKILDVLERPDYYAATVTEVRKHLAAKHSYRLRLEELLEIIRG
jgi:hypothetical protein